MVSKAPYPGGITDTAGSEVRALQSHREQPPERCEVSLSADTRSRDLQNALNTGSRP